MVTTRRRPGRRLDRSDESNDSNVWAEMASKRSQRRVQGRRAGRPWFLAIPLGAAALVGGVAVFLSIPQSPGSGSPAAGSQAVAWTRLGTQDVHSLAFAPGSTDRLLFGHHGGVLETEDGGRTWDPLAVDADAMGMRPAEDGSIVIAGHDVFEASYDAGRSWASIPNDLPSLDIHAFARDPDDPRRMWAYLAEGGLYESLDGGIGWSEVYDGHRPALAAISRQGVTALIGLDPFTGLAESDDGGRSWRSLGAPPSSPVLTLAATPDGSSILLGSTEGLFQSDDGGVSWSEGLLAGVVLAAAISEDGTTVAAVTRETDFYRSDDGGRTWSGPT